MKILILISLSVLSLNVFSAELGEEQKSPCPYLDQSSKRDAKVVLPVEVDIKKKGSEVISK